MRALTVRQPWAWAIIHGGKDVENRSRNIAGDYRGPVAIHAGLADADNAPDELWLRATLDDATTVLREPGKSLIRWQPRGVIIGVAHLWAVHKDAPACCPNRLHQPNPWAMDGYWHLCLSHPRPLPEPIPCRGALGLWTLPEGIAAQVAEVTA